MSGRPFLKRWDVIKHRWTWAWMPRYGMFHQTPWRWSHLKWSGDEMGPDCSKWGEVWLIWLLFAIKEVTP